MSRAHILATPMTALFFAVRLLAGPVPPPSETPARLIVSGRTSTAVDIKIVKVGQNVPETFSAPKVKNAPRHTWYVSQHFALRSELDEATSRDYLEVCELAYPHYVWIFGAEPLGIESKRIALSYSKSMASLKKCTRIDLGGVGYLGGGGGVTLNSNKVSYNYPSGGLAYHRRALVIHEDLHAFQMCLVNGHCGSTPVRFAEGITYATEMHVFNKAKKQLTVMVLDRAPPNDHFDNALRQLKKKFVPAGRFYGGSGDSYMPAVYALWTQFLWADADRRMKQRIFIDQMIKAGMYNRESPDHKALDKKLMNDLFGPAEELNKAWVKWVNARQNTFHYVDWGWEQDGDTLWSYGWPNKGRYAQENVYLRLDEEPKQDPVILDYPVYAKKPCTIGKVARGVEEPSVGCLLDFSKRNNGGKAGLGFGVGGAESKKKVDQELLGVLVQSTKGMTSAKLLFDGRTVGIKDQTRDLPADFVAAVRKNAYQVGMTVTLKKDVVSVVLRTGEDDQKHVIHELPIDAALRKRMLNKPWAILSKGNIHGITLFPDVIRTPANDLTKTAPTGRSRFAGEQDLFGLCKAAFLLGREAPQSLIRLRDRMLKAADGPAAKQREVIEKYTEGIDAVLADVGRVADKSKSGEALAAMLGIRVYMHLSESEAGKPPKIAVILVNGRARPIEGTLRCSKQVSAYQLPVAGTHRLTVAPGSGDHTPQIVNATAQVTTGKIVFSVQAQLRLYPSIPTWHTIGPFDNKGDGKVDTKQVAEDEAFSKGKAYAGKDGKRVTWQVQSRKADLSPNAENVVRFGEIYGGENVSAYAHTWIESPKQTDAILGVGSDDGVVVWLNGKRVHTNLVNRGYLSLQDRVPIKLKKGRNELRVRVMQGNGGWCFSASVLDRDGNPMTGLRYSLGEAEK